MHLNCNLMAIAAFPMSLLCHCSLWLTFVYPLLVTVYINEVGNDVAAKSVNIALNYVKKNPSLGLSVDMVTVEGNRSDSKGMLEASEWFECHYHIHTYSTNHILCPVCMTYSRQLLLNKPPHVILDTTLSGLASETVKSLSSALGIPTISGSFGQEGDLRQWRDISTKKKSYLLQVRVF